MPMRRLLGPGRNGWSDWPEAARADLTGKLNAVPLVLCQNGITSLACLQSFKASQRGDVAGVPQLSVACGSSVLRRGFA